MQPATNGVNGHANGAVTTNGSTSHPSWRDPKPYHMLGTHPDSKILFLDVNILDSTGREPYRGDVYIAGERIVEVGVINGKERLVADPRVRVIHGNGRTLMSGLGDAHAHLSWNGGDIEALGELPVEEHTMLTAKAAECYLEYGYTMCFGAAAAKDRLDIVIRDAINGGDIPGPRSLANAREMARHDGELCEAITAYADGPDEMREVIRDRVSLGVDNVKLSMSGDEITETRLADDCYFTDEETAACVEEAHKYGKMVCAHARARDSVTMCVKHGVEVIYHASYADDEAIDALAQAKDRFWIVPALGFPYATAYEAEAMGFTPQKRAVIGSRKEIDIAVRALREMHKRGVKILPGGDYGFAWNPHGRYARDLELFVNLLGFTPMESILAATAGVAELFMRTHELGKIQPGYLADCILVNGNPLQDIKVLQDRNKLDVIVINGRMHKVSFSEFTRTPAPSFPEVPKQWQIEVKGFNSRDKAEVAA